MKAHLTLKEAADQLGLHVYTARRLIHAGHIKVIRYGPRGWFYIPRSEVERLLTPKKVTA